MEVYQVKSVKFHAGAANEEEKRRGAEERARCLQHLFEQWQKPLGIDGEEHRKYLTEELLGYCDEPLLKSLIESIT